MALAGNLPTSTYHRTTCTPCLTNTRTPMRQYQHSNSKQDSMEAKAPAAPLAVQQTQMRTGQRYRILLSAGGYRTGLPSVTTVCLDLGGDQKVATTLIPLVGKKLKRRLEDLERRAGTTDGPASGGDNKQTSPKSGKKAQSAPKAQKQQSSVHVAAVAQPQKMPQSQFTPPMHTDDDYLFPPTPYDERERSHSPQLFAYSTYPAPPEDMLLPTYGGQHHQSYRPMTTAEPYPDYLTATVPVPVTLPSMTHFSDAIKREGFGEDSGLSPYMYGSYLPGIDMNAPSPYDNSNPHVSSARHLPPLPHHRSAFGGDPSASSTAPEHLPRR